jgi:hypothetical protein
MNMLTLKAKSKRLRLRAVTVDPLLMLPILLISFPPIYDHSLVFDSPFLKSELNFVI